MDFQKLLLSPEGRIKRQDFWVGSVQGDQGPNRYGGDPMAQEEEVF